MLIAGIIVSIFAVFLIIFPKAFLKSKSAEVFILRRLSEHDSKKSGFSDKSLGNYRTDFDNNAVGIKAICFYNKIEKAVKMRTFTYKEHRKNSGSAIASAVLIL